MNLHQLVRVLKSPSRTVRILAKRGRSLRWDWYADQIPEPKSTVGSEFMLTYANTEEVEGILEELIESDAALEIRRIDAELSDFRSFLDAVSQHDYFSSYTNFYKGHLTKKLLEIYFTEKQATFHPDEIYIDVGSEFSVSSRYFREKYGAKVYELDLQNRPGVHGNKIGASAGDIPLEDDSVSGMYLHCSFEHFENDADIGLANECKRLLKPGGWLYIAPLYLYPHDAIATDPVESIPGKVNFDNMHIFCIPRFWNRYARMYAPKTYKERIVDRLPSGTSSIIKITNHIQFGNEFNDLIPPYHFLFVRN